MVLPPGPHAGPTARELPARPEELPSWHGQASCLGSGIKIQFSLFIVIPRQMLQHPKEVPSSAPTWDLLPSIYFLLSHMLSPQEL